MKKNDFEIDKKNIIQALRNASVALEQGGKYDWNKDLQECNDWIEWIIQEVNKLKQCK